MCSCIFILHVSVPSEPTSQWFVELKVIHIIFSLLVMRSKIQNVKTTLFYFIPLPQVLPPLGEDDRFYTP